ncbi:hypothetical protein C6Q23_30025, partial [Burkholderia multivorans]
MVGGTPLRGARTVRTIITSGARRCLHRCPPDCPRTARHRRRLPAPRTPPPPPPPPPAAPGPGPPR